MIPPRRSCPPASRSSQPEHCPHGTWPSGHHLSWGYIVLQSLLRSALARRLPPPSSSPGLWSPTALEETRSRSTRASEPAAVRLQGLATLLAPCSPRVPAGFVSRRRRSWGSPFGASPRYGYSGIPAEMDPPAVRDLGAFPARRNLAGKAPCVDSWALTPQRVPGRQAGPESPPATRCSLGFLPF
jgi:hypothetical protein